MADNFPSVGLRIDLNELVTAREEYGRLEREILNIGDAAGKAARQADAANAEQLRLLRQRMALTKQMFDEENALSRNSGRMMGSGEILAAQRRLTAGIEAETAKRTAAEKAAQEESLRNFRRMIDLRIEAGRRAAAEQAGVDRDSFEFQRRMWRQRVQEAERASKAELDAARAAEASWARARARGGGGAISAGGLRIGSLGDAFTPLMQSGVGIVTRFTDALSGFRNTLGGIRSALFDARTAIAVFLGAMIVGPVIGMADAMTALEARTRFYAARASDVPTTFQAIYRTAQDARAPLEAVATLYTRLAPLAERLGRSQADILNVARTVAQGAAIGGATPEEAKSSSQQLAQALASNRLGGDELRSLAENAPILLAEIARSLNMNSGEFIKWAHAGKANAEVVIGAIEQASGRISEMFSRMPVTVGQAITVVGNAFQHFVGEVDRATNASQNLANSIVGLRAFFEDPNTINTAAAAINGLGTALKFLGDAVKFIGQSTPVIVAFIAAMAGARILPPILLAAQRAFVVFAAGASGIGTASMAANIGMSAMAAGAVRARTALSGVLGIVGGPLGAAVIAATAAWTYYTTTQMSAVEAAEKFQDVQGNAGSAIERAIGFADRYGASTANLTKILLGLNNVQDEQTKGLDEAGRAAVARAENERRLTIALLARAAAEQTAAAAELRRSTFIDKAAAVTQRTLSRASITQSAREGWREKAERSQSAADFKEKLASELDAGAKASLAAIEEVRGMKLDITTPAEVPGGGRSSSSPDNKNSRGMASAINSISALRAEVAGLKAEAAAIDSNPLAAFTAQIEKAAAVAEGRRTAGKGALFQTEAGQLAAQKEELQIRMRLLSTMAEQSHASELELMNLQETRRAADEVSASWTRYFGQGAQQWEDYDRAIKQAADAELAAKMRQNELNVAMQYGVTSVKDIAGAYMDATGASAADARSLQNHAEKALADANAVDILNDANQRRADLDQRLSQANQAVADLRRDDRTELAFAEQTALVRAADRRAQILASQIYLQAQKDGLAITEAQAMNAARTLALVEEYALRIARLKVDIQDSIRDAFIQTGKLDFSSLRKSLTQEMRRAVYDALLAKPINIIVNAVVDVATQGLQRLLGNVLYGQGGTGGGLLGGITNLFGGGGGFGFDGQGYGAGSLKAMDDLVDSVTGVAKATSGITAALGSVGRVLGTAAQVFAYSQVGTGLAGLINKPKNPQNAQIGGLIGGAAGFIGGSVAGAALGAGGATLLGMQAGAVLGPVGAIVGALAGALLGGFLGPKPTNAGAGIEILDNARIGRITGDKRTAETEQAGRAAAQAIIDGVKALQDAGITATEQITGLVIGTRDQSQIYTSTGKTLYAAKGDVGAAAEAGLKEILLSATYVDEAQKTFVTAMVNAGKAFDEIIASIQKFTEARKFGESIGREILRYTDPKAYAIANLRDAQKERRDQLTKYGAEGYLTADQVAAFAAQLTQLEGLELADTLKQFADGVSGATHSLQEFKDQQARIKEYVTGLMGGDLSPLNPQARLEYNASTFYAQLRKAQGGDYEALSGITGFADTYLRNAREFYGGTEGYANIASAVQAALEALSTQEFADPQVAAISEASAQISSAVAAGSQQVVDALMAANEALMDQIAAQTEAQVAAATTPGGATFDPNLAIALNGGLALA